MSISFDNIFGVHSRALNLRNKRAEILAGNLANADTPGYKAQDMDFKAAMAQALRNQNGGSGTHLATTNQKHLTGSAQMPDGTRVFRESLQPDTGDGNTVDVSVERMAYMENSIDYQTTLTFLNGKISNLRRVLSGE